MKKLLTLLFVSLVFLACSSDDDSVDGTLVGGWDISQFIVPNAVDLDNDGIPSTNVLEELPCFSATVTFLEDGTYGARISEITVDAIVTNEGETIIYGCDPATVDSGTWVLNGNQLTTTTDGFSETQTINLSGDTFSFTISDETFEGQVTWIFTRR